MTQEAECEKTRAPNHLFACLRKNQKGGKRTCKTSGLQRRLVRNTTHRDIQTQTLLLFFHSHNTMMTLCFLQPFFPQVFQCNGRKPFNLFIFLLRFLSVLRLRGRHSQSPASDSTSPPTPINFTSRFTTSLNLASGLPLM